MPDFKFFSEAYLQKGGDPRKGIRVGGALMTENKDVDGEEVIPIDWSYFDKGFGKIKYEHIEFKGPKAIIGFPMGRSKKGKTHFFEGELIPFDPDAPEEKLTPQQRLAKETYTLLEHIEDHNKTHPNNQQRAGWSIEGNYVKHKSLKPGQVGARIVDVVFTTQPRNMETFATILKSLSAPEGTYGMTPATQTGWAVLRTESLNNSNSNKKESSNKKETTMFNTKHDVYKSCKAKGMNHEDALKEANEWEQTTLKERQDEYGKAEKSLGSSKDKLAKSLAVANEVEGIEVEIDMKPIRKSLQKSLQADKEGNIDVQAFLENVNDTVLAVAEAIPLLSSKIDRIAKSLGTSAEAGIDQVENLDYLRKATAVNNEQLRQTNTDLALLVQTLTKSLGGGLSTDKLQKSNGAGKETQDNNAGSEDFEPKKLQKSQVTFALGELVKEGKVRPVDVTMWEGSSYMSEATEKVFKSYAKEKLNLG